MALDVKENYSLEDIDRQTMFHPDDLDRRPPQERAHTSLPRRAGCASRTGRAGS